MNSSIPNICDADLIRTIGIGDFKKSVIETQRPILACFISQIGLDYRYQIECLNGIASALQDSVNILQIDPQASPELVGLFNVTSFPDMILFNRGRIIRRFTGVTTDWRLLAAIQEAVR